MRLLRPRSPCPHLPPLETRPFRSARREIADYLPLVLDDPGHVRLSCRVRRRVVRPCERWRVETKMRIGSNAVPRLDNTRDEPASGSADHEAAPGCDEGAEHDRYPPNVRIRRRLPMYSRVLIFRATSSMAAWLLPARAEP